MSSRTSATSTEGTGQGGKSTAEACVNDCGAPYNIVGKGSAVDSLCKDGSDFRHAYAACIGCVKSNAGSADAAVTDLLPGLAPIVSVCSSVMVTSTVTIVRTDGDLSTLVLLVDASTTSAPARVTNGPPWGTGTPPWGTGRPPWGDGPPPWITAARDQSDCPDGTSTKISPESRSLLPMWCSARWASDELTPSTTPGPRPAMSTGTLTTSSTPTGEAGNATPNKETSSNKAWIAGPIIGALFGIAVVVGVLLFMRRRKRATAAHAADAEQELEAAKAAAELRCETVYEMEGSSPIDMCAEKPANEFPAKELVS